jgi:hypothetical protein
MMSYEARQENRSRFDDFGTVGMPCDRVNRCRLLQSSERMDIDVTWNECDYDVSWNDIDIEPGMEQILDQETGLMNLSGTCAERARRIAYAVLGIASLPLLGLTTVDKLCEQGDQISTPASFYISREVRTDNKQADARSKREDSNDWK